MPVNSARQNQHIVIAGGSGFIGRYLIQALISSGHTVTVLSRHADVFLNDPEFSHVPVVPWSPETTAWYTAIDVADAVINLSGRNLARGRWSAAAKRDIRDSRVQPSQALADALSAVTVRPRCLIQFSAVGFYGVQTPMNADEKSPSGAGFLAGVVRDWENAVAPAAELPHIRMLTLRTGIVLGPDGGLYKRLSCLVRHYMGAVIGDGTNWMSWIHLHDLIGIVQKMLKTPGMHGVYNAVAPEPVRNRDFMLALAKTWHRPLVPAPPLMILRAVLGDLVNELILASQHVHPKRLQEEHFYWKYPTAETALDDIYRFLREKRLHKAPCEPV